MWECIDNQEVGLEAATLERVRNSSLVKRARAENVTGLSIVPKLRIVQLLRKLAVVGEHSHGREG